jgi:hypothetical protein
MFLTLPSLLIEVKDFLKVGCAIDINTEIATRKSRVYLQSRWPTLITKQNVSDIV